MTNASELLARGLRTTLIDACEKSAKAGGLSLEPSVMVGPELWHGGVSLAWLDDELDYDDVARDIYGKATRAGTELGKHLATLCFGIRRACGRFNSHVERQFVGITRLVVEWSVLEISDGLPTKRREPDLVLSD